MDKLIIPIRDVGKVSDGYHTFDELYEHRIILFIALCRLLSRQEKAIGYVQSGDGFVWRSKLHTDGSSWKGWFIMGINKVEGEQITYHLPIGKWEETKFADTLDKAPVFDDHTPEDVLKRLAGL